MCERYYCLSDLLRLFDADQMKAVPCNKKVGKVPQQRPRDAEQQMISWLRGNHNV